MTDTFTEDELTAEDIGPEADEPDYNAKSDGSPSDGPDLSFLDSPDFADFLKRPRTATARDYEKRTASALKTVMLGLLQSPGTVPDAAAIIWHGSSFASAAGVLADADKRAAKMLDLLTSPENPYIAFGIAAIPFIAQIIRNHESQLEAAPAKWKQRRKLKKEGKAPVRPGVTLTLPFIKKKINIPVRFRLRLSVFRSQSMPTEVITQKVFSDAKVRRELRKMGVGIGE